MRRLASSIVPDPPSEGGALDKQRSGLLRAVARLGGCSGGRWAVAGQPLPPPRLGPRVAPGVLEPALGPPDAPRPPRAALFAA